VELWNGDSALRTAKLRNCPGLCSWVTTHCTLAHCSLQIAQSNQQPRANNQAANAKDDLDSTDTQDTESETATSNKQGKAGQFQDAARDLGLAQLAFAFDFTDRKPQKNDSMEVILKKEP